MYERSFRAGAMPGTLHEASGSVYRVARVAQVSEADSQAAVRAPLEAHGPALLTNISTGNELISCVISRVWCCRRGPATTPHLFMNHAVVSVRVTLTPCARSGSIIAL